MTTDWSKTASPIPKTCAIVESLGIDPRRIWIKELDINGYWEIQVDEEGQRLRDPSDPTRIWMERRPWPSMQDALRVLDQFIQEGGARL